MSHALLKILLAAAFILGVSLSSHAQVIIQTQQPVVADTSGATVGTEVTLASVLAAVEELRDEIVADNPVRTYGEATNTGGQSLFYYVTTASVNTSGVTTTPTGVYTKFAFNPTETEAFIRFYNDNTPDCTSATGFVYSMGIPPSPAAGQQGGFILPLAVPITGPFTTALGFCVTGGPGSTDNTAAPAGILIGIGYKVAP